MSHTDICKFEKINRAFTAINFVIPPIQRGVNNEVVDKIYLRENEFYKAHGKYLAPGTISIAQCCGKEHLIDGQHRMQAYSKLSAEFPERELMIAIDYYYCTNMEQLESIYKMANTSTPNDIATMSVNSYKVKQEIVDFFKKQFGTYLKNTSKPNAPCVNLDAISERLDKVQLDKFQIGEFTEYMLELNKYYAGVNSATLAKWHVEKKYAELIRQRPNQLFLGMYREHEWIDRIMQLKDLNDAAKTNVINPAQIEHYSATYRVKITKKLRKAVWDCEKMEQPCYCCKESVSFDNFHCGHIIAVSRGGETTKNNLRVVCPECNIDMGIMNLNDYCKLLAAQM